MVEIGGRNVGQQTKGRLGVSTSCGLNPLYQSVPALSPRHPLCLAKRGGAVFPVAAYYPRWHFVRRARSFILIGFLWLREAAIKECL